MQLKAENISFRYSKKEDWILKDVNVTINQGERVGIVGPSGYGKSTLAGILAGLRKATLGTVTVDGTPLKDKGYCPVQMIYQHPELSVNPRWKMGKILTEAWIPDSRLLEQLGIEESWLSRWPSELSGGELQRFCIARVLSPRTQFLICDEITTMLDVITQAQMWNLLLNISKERNLGMIIITHNRNLAKKVCTRIIDLTEMNHVVND